MQNTKLLEYNTNKDAENPNSLAITKVSGVCMRDDLEKILESLDTVRNTGIDNIVVFGWGENLTERLSLYGYKPDFIDGSRVTDEFTMSIIQEIIEKYKTSISKYNSHLRNCFAEKPVEAKKYSDELGLVGYITDIDTSAIANILQDYGLAFVPPLGYDRGMYLNINADTVSSKLAKEMDVTKYIALTKTGGVYGDEDELIPNISLNENYESMKSLLSGGMLKKVEKAGEVLKEKPELSVKIISPEYLTQELVSDTEYGTKILYQSYKLSEDPSFQLIL